MSLPNPANIPATTNKATNILYHNIMTPEWLWRNGKLDNAIKDGKSISTLTTKEKEEMSVKSDTSDYDSLISIKLLDSAAIPDPGNTQLNIKIVLTADVNENVYDPLSVMISNGNQYDGSSRPYAVGFQMQDISKYKDIGPFLAIEGVPETTLEDRIIYDQTKESLSKWNQQRYPERFEMNFVPNMNWASCYCATEYGGLSLSKVYSEDAKDKLHDGIQSDGLFLNLFRGGKAETYRLDYLEVMVTATQLYNRQNT